MKTLIFGRGGGVNRMEKKRYSNVNPMSVYEK